MSESETNRRLMEELTDRFMNDPDFREQMRQDPEGTVERSGVRWTKRIGKR